MPVSYIISANYELNLRNQQNTNFSTFNAYAISIRQKRITYTNYAAIEFIYTMSAWWMIHSWKAISINEIVNWLQKLWKTTTEIEVEDRYFLSLKQCRSCIRIRRCEYRGWCLWKQSWAPPCLQLRRREPANDVSPLKKAGLSLPCKGIGLQSFRMFIWELWDLYL